MADLSLWLQRHECQLYMAFLGALVLAAWCPFLSASFILDETGTVWTISAGVRDIVRRATDFPQSILYSFFIWAVAAIAGTGEIALRVPSVAAAVASAYLLYKIGTRLADKTTGLIGALLWALLPVVTSQATLARPYMMGSLAVIASYWALLRWLDRPTIHTWLTYLVLAALPAYFSYFFILVLLVQLPYVIVRAAPARNIPRWQLVSLPFCVALLELPVLPPLLAAWSTRATRIYLTTPGPSAFVEETIPIALAYALVAGLSVSFILPLHARYRRMPISTENLVLIGSWAAIPVLMFALSVLTPTKVFTGRYLMAAAPVQALFFACLLRGLQPASLRVAIMAIAVVLAAIGIGPEEPFWHHKRWGDYRAASAFLARLPTEDSLPIFAFSGFVEAKHLPFPVSEYDASALLAPFLVYPVAKPVTLLPSALHPGSRQYIERFVTDVHEKYSGFLLYAQNPTNLPDWFTKQVAPAFHEEWLHLKTDVSIVRYTRSDHGRVHRVTQP